jgi:hypothetical protein
MKACSRAPYEVKRREVLERIEAFGKADTCAS